MLKIGAWLAMSLLTTLVFGCSKQENVATTLVRGEPINSQSPATPSAAVSDNKDVTVKPVPVAEAKPAITTEASPATEKSGITKIGFDKLAAYTFNVPDGVIPPDQVGKSETQIPKEVKAFDQKEVAITGFMLPLKVDSGLVTELLVMKDQSMCCYGSIPRINDWVSVKMKNGGVKSVMDQPVTLYGKMHVGEMLENGYLVGIYEMAGEKMDDPKN